MLVTLPPDVRILPWHIFLQKAVVCAASVLDDPDEFKATGDFFLGPTPCHPCRYVAKYRECVVYCALRVGT